MIGKKLYRLFLLLVVVSSVFFLGCTEVPATNDGTAGTSGSSSGSSTGTGGTTSPAGTDNNSESPGGLSGLDGQAVGENGTAAQSGSLQERIAQEARNLEGSENFRGPEVNYGTKACAQVVSTALKAAGAIGSVVTGVLSLIDSLHSQGWQDVSAPPFQEGDVITWSTYDRNGDGAKDADTHVGIVVSSGGSLMAMNNSSSLKTPRITDIYLHNAPGRVMRKA